MVTATSYFSFLLSLTPSLVRATCYWQNSTLAPDDPFSIATDDSACFPDQQNSPCCGTGWTCLSDGVCHVNQEGNDFYYRGTCTDRTWDSQQCPGWCFAQNANTSIPLAKCNTEQDWYCCPGDPNCDCETGKFAVKLGDSQPSTVTVIGSTSWPGITSTTAAFTQQPLNTEGTSTGSSEDTTTTDSETSTSEAGTSAQLTGSDTMSGSQAAASASSTAGPNITASDNGGSSNVGLAAGLGAGLGAAAVIIAGLAFFLIRSRRRKHAAKTNEKAESGQSDNQIPGVGAPPHSQSYTGKFGNGYGGGGQQYYDPPNHMPQQPGEMPVDGHRRAELGNYDGRGGHRMGERAELGG